MAFSLVIQVKDQVNLLQFLNCFFSSKHFSPCPSREEWRWSSPWCTQEEQRHKSRKHTRAAERFLSSVPKCPKHERSEWVPTNWRVQFMQQLSCGLGKVSTLISAVSTAVIASAISHAEILAVSVSYPVLQLVLPKALQMCPKGAPLRCLSKDRGPKLSYLKEAAWCAVCLTRQQFKAEEDIKLNYARNHVPKNVKEMQAKCTIQPQKVNVCSFVYQTIVQGNSQFPLRIYNE